MSTDKLWTVISGIEYQLNILKDKLKNLDEETKQSVDEAYQRGLQDGKAISDKGCEGCRFEETRCTACENCCNSHMNHWTAKDDEIKVGDVVTIKYSDKHTFVVTKVSDQSVWGVDESGSWNYWAIDEVIKTDKHYDIDKILEALKE